MININSKVFIAGHKGMLGSSILRILKKKGCKKRIITIGEKLDLRDQIKVRKFIKKKKPDAVIIAAQKLVELKPTLTIPRVYL